MLCCAKIIKKCFVVVVVAAEFCRVDSPWPEKIRVRSGYVDPNVMETAKKKDLVPRPLLI